MSPSQSSRQPQSTTGQAGINGQPLRHAQPSIGQERSTQPPRQQDINREPRSIPAPHQVVTPGNQGDENRYQR
jgi:hypothetical protein